MSFNAQLQINNKVPKFIRHIALNFSKENESRLTSRFIASIVLKYMKCYNPWTAQGELFNGSQGLLCGNDSPYNAADAEAYQEIAEMLRRKKRKKRLKL